MLKVSGYDGIIESESIQDTSELLVPAQQKNNYTDEGPAEISQIDLVLINTPTPGLDGIELAGIMKNHPSLESIPIIVISTDDNTNLESAFRVGAVDYIKRPVNKTELRARVGMALKLKEERDLRKKREKELLHLTQNLEYANQRLQAMTRTDALTNIPNRLYFNEIYAIEWFRALRQQHEITILMIDIDNFKKFNDTYGHLAGDECLKQIASVVNKCIMRAGDFAARYGGEEFIICLPNHGIKDGLAVANRLLQMVSGLNITHSSSDVSQHVTVSIGAAFTIPSNEMDMNSLIQIADKALYSAKKSGRNKVVSA
jgi:diguanylate cyclase (GGDEF)-like protein